MYCVKCGVRLEENAKVCPLCNTPVWNPDQDADVSALKPTGYSDKMPYRKQKSRKPALILLTAICAFVIVLETVLCLLIYKEFKWSGYVTGGVLLGYVYILLPLWFREPRAELLVPIDHIATALFLAYVNWKTGGHWFLSFALPLCGASGLISTVMICLLKYVKKGRLFIFGGSFIILGLFCFLVEFMTHLTFGTRMFVWSQFAMAAFAATGILLILAGFIKPLRAALEKYFNF